MKCRNRGEGGGEEGGVGRVESGDCIGGVFGFGV